MARHQHLFCDIVQVGNREDKTERVKVTVTLKVEGVEYAGDSECRCKGRCTSENRVIELGSYHTITLKPQTPITVAKALWDRLDVARLEEAADPAAGADLAIVLVTDGLAHVCLIGRSATLMRAKVCLFGQPVRTRVPHRALCYAHARQSVPHRALGHAHARQGVPVCVHGAAICIPAPLRL